MKRVLSLVLALVMVFGTIMPAFAEETVAVKTSGEMLQAYGLIDGTDKGLEEDQPLTRSQMAKILAKLNGKADVAATYAFPSSFTDVPADKWYAGYVAYAEAQGWMDGDAKGGTFRPEDNLKVQEINKLMVEALGYTVAYADVNAKAEELKIAVVAADKTLVLRGEIFAAMVTTLDVPKKDETDTLGTSLALVGYTSPTPAIPETLEVVTVVTDNLKTIVVEFNQELLAKSVNTTNFKVTGLTVSKALLGEDKKTVTLDMSSEIPQSKEIELVITKVKDATEAKTIADYKTKFVVNDVTVPVVESITVVDAKHVMIQASEPMNFAYGAYTVLPGVKIDGNAVIGKVVADNQMNTYTIEFNSVKKEGSYKMAIEGLKDYAKLAAVKKDFTFDVAKDDTAPVAVSAKAASVTVVEVTFDEPLATIGTITINGKTTTETYKADSSQKVVLATLDPADKLTLGATVEVNVKYKGQKDVVGNEVKTETALTFKVTDDTTMPTATLEVKAGNKMVFTFSKAMDTTLGKIIVLDKDKKIKKEVTITSLASTTWNTEKTVLTVPATSLDAAAFMLSNTDPAEAYLQLKDMKDSTVRANLLATIDLSATLLDTKKPTVSAKYVFKAGTEADKTDDTITFFFSEMMDEDSIKNLSNYLQAGTTPLSGKDGVKVNSVATDKKSIKITYPGARDLTDVIANEFVVIAVKDNAGNMIATDIDNKIKASGVGVALDKIEGAVATKTTQVKVEFPVEIKSIDPAALAVYDKGTTTAHSTVSSIASIDGVFVTINLVTALTTDAAAYDVKVVSPTLITSTYDAHFEKAALTTDDVFTIVDEIAPTVASLADGKWDITLTPKAVAATPNMAVIKMSEVATGLFDENDLVVKLNGKILLDTDYEISNVIDTLYYNVTVSSNSQVTLDGVYSLSVELVRDSTTVKDANNNFIAPFVETISDFDYDYTVPTITSVEYKDAGADGTIDTIEIVMSQNVDSSTVLATDFVIAAGTDAVAQLSTVTSTSVVDNKITLGVTGVATTTVTDDTLAWAVGAFTVMGNDVAVRTAATMTDKAAPMVKTQLPVAATLVTGTDATHTLVFSEALDVITAGTVKTAVDAAYAPNGSATASSAWSGATLTVTYTAAAATDDLVYGSIGNLDATDVNANAATGLDVQQ